MGRTEKARGSRALSIRDWPFGSRGRRLFLEALLLDAPPPEGWRKSELEAQVEVERGGVDRLLAGAAAVGLVEIDGHRWLPVQPAPTIAVPLSELTQSAGQLSEQSIAPLPKRSYKRRVADG